MNGKAYYEFLCAMSLALLLLLLLCTRNWPVLPMGMFAAIALWAFYKRINL